MTSMLNWMEHWAITDSAAGHFFSKSNLSENYVLDVLQFPRFSDSNPFNVLQNLKNNEMMRDNVLCHCWSMIMVAVVTNLISFVILKAVFVSTNKILLYKNPKIYFFFYFQILRRHVKKEKTCQMNDKKEECVLRVSSTISCWSTFG